MPKFVLRCKANHNYFLHDQCGNEITFTDNIEAAYNMPCHILNSESAKVHFVANHSQLAYSLFEVYEIPEPKYAIRVVGTELYVESIFNYTQFTEELCRALEKSSVGEINKILDKIKNKVKSKLEIVVLLSMKKQ